MLRTSFIILGAAFIISVTRRMIHRLDQLEGILPVCSSCKDIKEENGHSHQVEGCVVSNSKADFSHALCPESAKASGLAFDTQLALKT